MKIEIPKIDLEQSNVLKTDTIKISQKNMAHAFRAFVNYSNPIGSILREITSNAWDAHVEANVDKPIIVCLHNNVLSITDFGTGMSQERITNVFTEMFTSTKNETNEQIGAFGMGSKSPFGYTDSFYIKTIYDNVEYLYNLFMTNGLPEISLISTKQVEQHNGTTVLIPIKKEDTTKVEENILDQLYYFKNVYYDGMLTHLNEKIKYIECEEYFIQNKNSNDLSINVPYITIGPVRYPITNLEIRKIYSTYDSLMSKVLQKKGLSFPGFYYKFDNFSFNRYVVKFEIGELDVIWNREDLQYSDKTIHALKTKLTRVFDNVLASVENTTFDTFLNGFSVFEPCIDRKAPYLSNFNVSIHTESYRNSNVDIFDFSYEIKKSFVQYVINLIRKEKGIYNHNILKRTYDFFANLSVKTYGHINKRPYFLHLRYLHNSLFINKTRDELIEDFIKKYKKFVNEFTAKDDHIIPITIILENAKTILKKYITEYDPETLELDEKYILFKRKYYEEKHKKDEDSINIKEFRLMIYDDKNTRFVRSYDYQFYRYLEDAHVVMFVPTKYFKDAAESYFDFLYRRNIRIVGVCQELFNSDIKYIERKDNCKIPIFRFTTAIHERWKKRYFEQYLNDSFNTEVVYLSRELAAIDPSIPIPFRESYYLTINYSLSNTVYKSQEIENKLLEIKRLKKALSYIKEKNSFYFHYEDMIRDEDRPFFESKIIKPPTTNINLLGKLLIYKENKQNV